MRKWRVTYYDEARLEIVAHETRAATAQRALEITGQLLSADERERMRGLECELVNAGAMRDGVVAFVVTALTLVALTVALLAPMFYR